MKTIEFRRIAAIQNAMLSFAAYSAMCLFGVETYGDPIVANIDADTATVAHSTDNSVTLTNSSTGNYEIGVGGAALSAADGVMLATMRANAISSSFGTVEVTWDGPFAGTAMALSVRVKGDATPTALAGDTAMAWFPYADGGTIGANVNADGTIHSSSSGITQSMISKVTVNTAVAYDIVVSDAIKPETGMLFAVAASADSTDANQYQVASTQALTDGSGWRVANMNSTVSNTTSSIAGEFGFVYMPYSKPGLIGGIIDGSTGAKVTSAGDFTITRTTTGRYNIAVDGYTPDTGILLLNCYDTNGSGNPQDNYLTYAPSSDGLSFDVWQEDFNGVNTAFKTEDKIFSFAFLPIASVPEPNTFLMLVAACVLGALYWRRRNSV